MLGAMFFVQLLVYNYAGHFCSVNSRPIRLPSLFPPQEGVVMDVYPDIKPPYQDTDVTFNTTDYCFAWRGFGHHENVQLMAGLGTRRKSDDVAQFHAVEANEQGLLCEKYTAVNKNEKYFITIKASCSGGTTYVSSDGFTILNEQEISSSLKIFHGTPCSKHNKINISKSTTESKNIAKVDLRENLIAGLSYSLEISPNIDDFLEMKNTNIYVKGSHSTTTRKLLSFIPLDAINELILKINNDAFNLTDNFEFQLYRCDPHMDIQSSTSLLNIHWSLPDKYLSYVTHYEVGFCQSASGHEDCSDDIVFESSGNETVKEFHTHLKEEGFYKAAVKPCFGNACLSPVWSKGIKIANPMDCTIIREVSGRTDGSCLNIKMRLERLPCTSSENRNFTGAYRWALFTDEIGQHMISDWKTVVDKSHPSNIQVNNI